MTSAWSKVSDLNPNDAQDDAAERAVEELVQELAMKLRSSRNRAELTEYAVGALRESDEEAGQEERARASAAGASRASTFNPIAFGIPLLVVGAVLCATGILIGPGLGVIAIAVLMVLYGLVLSLLTGRSRPEAEGGGERD